MNGSRRTTRPPTDYPSASALDRQGAILTDAKRLPDALTAIERAAQIRERLASVNPAAGESAVAESWTNLGKILDQQGRTRRAASAARRAVKGYRALAADNPAAYEPGLALALGNLGMILLSRRHPHRALEPTREGLVIYRRLASVSPAAAEADLARALWTFALVRAAARKELPAARDAVMESIRILERLAEQHPAAFSGPLLAAYGTAAEILGVLGEHQKLRPLSASSLSWASSALSWPGAGSESQCRLVKIVSLSRSACSDCCVFPSIMVSRVKGAEDLRLGGHDTCGLLGEFAGVLLCELPKDSDRFVDRTEGVRKVGTCHACDVCEGIKHVSEV